MRKRKHLHVELLESRAMLSGLRMAAPPGVSALVAEPIQRPLSLNGMVRSTFTAFPSFAAPAPIGLAGTGRVRPLGQVNLSGVIDAPGLIAEPPTLTEAHLDVVLSNPRGSVTVRITPALTLANPLARPFRLRFHVVDGSGDFQGATGGGRAVVAFPRGVPELGQGGSFILTFRSDRLRR
jgi:hypothetical protein